MHIALDAFGGDNAPAATVAGAAAAAKLSRRNSGGLKVTLVAPHARVDELTPDLPEGLEILAVPGGASVGADDGPQAAGEDPESPIRTALRLHRQGVFDAVISAGSTGAQVIASLVELEKCAGITRPAIGSLLPTQRGFCLLIDSGASLVAPPNHLVQFAVMGLIYMQSLVGIRSPRIGVLNVGSESQTGDRSAVGAHKLLSESGLNYIGFVEGRELSAGVADVVVTNGLVGNILLKYAEGLPPLIMALAASEIKPAIKRLIDERFDYQTHGGEPLLGVKGVSVVCHGSSTTDAITAALLRTEKIIQARLPERIEQFLNQKFNTYFSRVKYLRSFRRTLRPSRQVDAGSGEQQEN